MSAAPIEQDPLVAARAPEAARAEEPIHGTEARSEEEAEESRFERLRRRLPRLAWLRRRLNKQVFKNSTFVALEVVATIVALGLSAIAMTWWWLSQGPVEVPAIRQHVEAELSEARNGRPVQIDRVELLWTARRGLELRAADVALLDAQRRPISTAREVAIGLSPWRLLIGQVRITRANFAGGEISVTRRRDGATHIAFGPPGTEPDIVIEPPPPNEALLARVNRVLDGLAATLRPVGAGGSLRALTVEGARLNIIDEPGGGRWQASDAAVELSRERAELRLSARANLEAARGHAPAAILIRTDTNFQGAQIRFTTNGVRPRAILSPAAMGIFAGLDAPMNAAIDIGLDRRQGVTSFQGDVSLGRGSVEMSGGRFTIEGGRVHGAYDLARDVLTIDQIALAGAQNRIRGAIRVTQASALLRSDRSQTAEFTANLPSVALDIPDVFPEAAALTNVRIAGRYNRPESQLEFDRIEAGIGQARLNLAGRVFWAEAANGQIHPGAQFEGGVAGVLDARDVVRVWPLTLARGAREYVGQALLGGRMTDLTIRADVRPDDIAAGALRNEALNIAWNFTGANFRYIPTMSPLTAGRGRALLQGNKFDVWVEDGRIENLAISQAHVELPRLSPKGAMASVRARADGDARSVVNLLRQQPIGLEGRLPVQPDTVVGRGWVTLVFQRPMLSDVPFEDLRFAVNGQFDGVGGLERDRRITFSNGALTVRGDQRAVTVSGRVRAGASNTNVEWVENLTRGLAAPSRYQISGVFDADDLQRLGYPVASVAQGNVGVTLRGAGRGYEVDSAAVQLDFRDAAVALPRNIWVKPRGQPTNARFDVGRAENGDTVLSNIEVRGPGLLAAQGEVRIARDRLVRAVFPRVQAPERADARVTVERGADNAYIYDVSGAFLDATPWMGEDPQALAAQARQNQQAAQQQNAQQHAQSAQQQRQAAVPIRGRVRVERLGLRAGAVLAQARAEFAVANDALIMLTAEGRDTVGGAFTLGLGQRPDNPQGRIVMRAADAGFAARALTGSENVRGGTATADGTWTPGVPARAQFTVRMRDFTAVRVPAMTRLLSSV
ncbi:MAG: DUF3971 domain-containing protein, partial [Hyphomonadaceae bacterium]